MQEMQEKKAEEILAQSFAQIINANNKDLVRLLEQSPGFARTKLLNEIDKLLINSSLQIFSGHQTKTAEALGINRGTLRSRIHDLNILGWCWRRN